ncbi:MAG: metal-sulfur cluster assembly factor [Ktedonobacteraceae bacterium]
MIDTAAIEETRKQVFEALREVYDPELGVNIVDLGLVYGVEVTPEGYVTLTMTLTTPGCPMHESIADGVGTVLQDVPGISDGEIKLVWTPRWEPTMMTDEGRRLLGF